MPTKIHRWQTFTILPRVLINQVLPNKELIKSPSIAYCFLYFTVSWVDFFIGCDGFSQGYTANCIIEESVAIYSAVYYVEIGCGARLIRVDGVTVVIVVSITVLECQAATG